MKTHTIKTPTAELMVVELPENIESDYSLIYGTAPEETYLSFRKNARFKPPRKSEKLENGIWMVLGKPDEIREEDARGLVENPIDKWGDDKYRFLDYNHEGFYDLFTATESLLSLIDSEIYWDVNPLGEKYDVELIAIHKSEIVGKHLIELWNKAEQKTFDRNRSLIFKKNK